MLFLFISIVLGNISTPTHDVPLAIFHIKKVENDIQLNISFDVEDFSESLSVKANQVDLDFMQKYLNKNTNFQFNTEAISFKILTVKTVRDHIKVMGVFDKTPHSIKSLKIKNNCLIDISNHSNIIQIDLNDQSKDFRMNKKRTVIHLNY